MLLYIVSRHLYGGLLASILGTVIVALSGNAAVLSDEFMCIDAVMAILLFEVALMALCWSATVFMHSTFVAIYLTYTFY